MLNRYGLIDIDKILREQGEEEQPAGDPGAAPPEAAAPPPPEEDPDEKIDAAREKSQDPDLAEFRQNHAAIIYRIAHDRGEAHEYSRNAAIRSLQQKFETSGVQKPFFIVFDPQTSGLKGGRHLSLIAALHHFGKVSGGKIKFRNAGNAASFAENAPALRDDLEFEVGEDPTTVKFRQAQPPEPAQPEMAQPPAPGGPPPPA
jgi:hypothetical protein